MAQKNVTRDMTQGSPLKLILTFSLPLLGGFLFQQLYSFMDTMVVGGCWARRRWRRWAIPDR